MLEKVKKINNWQVAATLTIVGLLVFSSGLNGQFQGDDIRQIVENEPVHSIKNIGVFFQGGTFYSGVVPNQLEGGFYRPLMTTSFSLLYTLFGAKPFYFHLFQLLLHIGSAFLLYLFFKKPFNNALALFLSLVFLIHPINSQSVFAIPSLQDPLFFIFGMGALLLLFNFQSKQSMFWAALLLFLSLLTKETGIIFVGMSVVFLFAWDRKRLLTLLGMLAPVFVIYFALRINAVGLLSSAHSAPIGRASLGQRLLTQPSIFSFYITKLIFPWSLASTYYWVVKSFSLSRVIIPVLVNTAALALFIYTFKKVRDYNVGASFKIFSYYALWVVLGLLLVAQLFPLDMTASETWMYMPLVGILGMLGVVFTVFRDIYKNVFFVSLAILLLLVFGIRSHVRGYDWRTELSIAEKDTKLSEDNHRSNSMVVANLVNEGKFAEAKPYAEDALKSYPNFNNYYNMAIIQANLGEYEKAQKSIQKSIPYSAPTTEERAFEFLCKIVLVASDSNEARDYMQDVLSKYPKNSNIWFYLAILEASQGNRIQAKQDIENAAEFGQVDPTAYSNIANGNSLTINIFDRTISIY